MNKNIVIVDIDGTISKIGKRDKYLIKEPKDWDSFYKDDFDDEPIKEMIELVELLSKKYSIIFCTSRKEIIRDKTQLWIIKNFSFKSGLWNSPILMRKISDNTSDPIFKINALKEAKINLNNIAFVLEDRTCNVEMFRSLGLICFQVADCKF